MENFIQYLEKMIEECDNIGGMEREKATYQSVLKEYRKQCSITPAVGQSEQLKCQCTKTEKYYDHIGDLERCQKCEKAL